MTITYSFEFEGEQITEALYAKGDYWYQADIADLGTGNFYQEYGDLYDALKGLVFGVM